MIKRPLIFLFLSFLFGILLQQCCKTYVLCIIFFVLCILFGILIQSKAFMKKLYGSDKILILIPFVFLFGCIRSSSFEEPYPVDEIIADKCKCSVTGIISDMSEKESKLCIALDDVKITIDEVGYDCGKILMYCDMNQDLMIGNRVSCKGKISRFEQAGNPGQFDEAQYYAIQGYHYKVMASDVVQLNTKSSPLIDLMMQQKRRIKDLYHTILTKEDYGLVIAMILGESDAIDEHIKNLYQRNGISHLLAISGLHITLIGMTIYRIIRRAKLGVSIPIFLTIAFVLYYGVFTGFHVSTNRAVVMMIISLCAIIAGKTYDIKCAMVLSAFMILIQNPKQMQSAGFLLSFAAIMGIVYINPILMQAFQIKNKLVQTILLSLSIQMISLPIVLSFFYEFSLYSIIINLIIIPLASILVGLAFIAGIAAFLFLPLGMFFAGGVHYILYIIQRICKIGLLLPCNTQVWGKPTRNEIIIYYFVLLLFCCSMSYFIYVRKRVCRFFENTSNYEVLEKLKHKEIPLWDEHIENGICIQDHTNHYKSFIQFKETSISYLPNHFVTRRNIICMSFYKLTYLIPLVFILLSSLVFLPNPVSGLEVTMLDVGQGDGIYIEEESGMNLLLDGGSSQVKELAKYRIVPFLKSKGRIELDYCIITHADEDHISGILELMEMNYPIHHIMLAKLQDPDEAYQRIIETARKAGIPVTYMTQDDLFVCGKLQFRCLHPRENFIPESANANSLVLLANYQQFQMLFTGDVEGNGEDELYQYLCAHRDLAKVDILKVAHHGSKNSTPLKFLQLTNPMYCLISAGKDNRYHHPSIETLERIESMKANVLSTIEGGAITIHTDGKKMRVTTLHP